MPLTPRLSNATVTAKIDAMTALLNGGFLDIYSGTQPATADTAITTQVRLASLALGTPAFGAGVNGVATANPIAADTDIAATATASWYRLWKSDHVSPVADGSVGLAGCNLNLESVALQQHGMIAVDSFALNEPKGS